MTMLGQVLEAGVLGLQLDQGVVATADFQYKPSARAVDPIIEILLTAEGLQRAAEPVMFGQPLLGLLRRNLRAGQTGAMNQRGERHETTPEILLGAYIAIAADVVQPPPAVTTRCKYLCANTRALRHFAQECRPFTPSMEIHMNVITTDLPGVLIIEPKVFGDERGFFYESFNAKAFQEATGLDTTIRARQPFALAKRRAAWPALPTAKHPGQTGPA